MSQILISNEELNLVSTLCSRSELSQYDYNIKKLNKIKTYRIYITYQIEPHIRRVRSSGPSGNNELFPPISRFSHYNLSDFLIES